MKPETVTYLLEITTAARDNAGAFFYNATLSPESKQHWHEQLVGAENALAELSSLPIT